MWKNHTSPWSRKVPPVRWSQSPKKVSPSCDPLFKSCSKPQQNGGQGSVPSNRSSGSRAPGARFAPFFRLKKWWTNSLALVNACKVNAWPLQSHQIVLFFSHGSVIVGCFCIRNTNLRTYMLNKKRLQCPQAKNPRSSSIESFQKQMQVVQIHGKGALAQHGFVVQDRGHQVGKGDGRRFVAGQRAPHPGHNGKRYRTYGKSMEIYSRNHRSCWFGQSIRTVQ